uniref:CBS domain-containing protein n=1 Tax=Cannabis sativa TaxID=3483 RepID=A0A803QGG1_CANSA
MAVVSSNLLSREVSDLCLGKPPLRSLSATATIAEALSAFKKLGETFLSVWTTNGDVSGSDLSCIGKNILALNYDDPASSALPLITKSLISQTSVAVIDGEGRLVGEISPSTLNLCDETVAAAIATLSAGDLMAYIDYGGPPEDLVQLVKDRLEEKEKYKALMEFIEEDLTTTTMMMMMSSDDESFGCGGKSGRLAVRSSEAIVCYPWSSLVAVMIQALAHRLSYVWVVEQDGTLVGIVTFASMLKVFRERLNTMA